MLLRWPPWQRAAAAPSTSLENAWDKALRLQTQRDEETVIRNGTHAEIERLLEVREADCAKLLLRKERCCKGDEHGESCITLHRSVGNNYGKEIHIVFFIAYVQLFMGQHRTLTELSYWNYRGTDGLRNPKTIAPAVLEKAIAHLYAD